MGVISSNKELSAAQIRCGDSFQITLSLTAEPDIVSNPTDIVLILDRSGSMQGSALASMKAGANRFIDIIDGATDSTQDGWIGEGSHIGVVSFAATALQDTQLITSVADLKSAVNALSAANGTNQGDAFVKALELLAASTAKEKVMVMFTDGNANIGVDPAPIAALAKAQGIRIYVIGLAGTQGIDEQALRRWASDPDSAYAAITPDEEELEDLFENLARNISNPGATNIRIIDRVSNGFQIVSVSAPTKGAASIVNSNTLRWTIEELGVSRLEGAALQFTVRHSGSCSGTVEVNESIEYRDDENNVVTFPSPKLNVDCGTVILPEESPIPVDLTVDGCEDTLELDAGELGLASLGRIVQLDVTIRNVCPNRRVALAAMLNEVDNEGNEYKRGLKTVTIPAHTMSSCRDVTVRCIKFVLPEDLDVVGEPDAMCNERHFRARFITHYIDHDFDCCEELCDR